MVRQLGKCAQNTAYQCGPPDTLSSAGAQRGSTYAGCLGCGLERSRRTMAKAFARGCAAVHGTDYMEQRMSFAFETVFSHFQWHPDGSYTSKEELIVTLQKAGYAVALLFVGLASSELSILRVRHTQGPGWSRCSRGEAASALPSHAGGNPISRSCCRYDPHVRQQSRYRRRVHLGSRPDEESGRLRLPSTRLRGNSGIGQDSIRLALSGGARRTRIQGCWAEPAELRQRCRQTSGSGKGGSDGKGGPGKGEIRRRDVLTHFYCNGDALKPLPVDILRIRKLDYVEDLQVDDG